MVRLLTAGRRATAGAAFRETGAFAGTAATGSMVPTAIAQTPAIVSYLRAARLEVAEEAAAFTKRGGELLWLEKSIMDQGFDPKV
jgi:hypothetical protein